MRLLHVPYSYYPDPVGGTEVYVAALARCQRSLGWVVAIAAPNTQNAAYVHDGIEIRRFAVSPSLGLRELYGEGDRTAARAFGRILDEFEPDAVHLHAFTSAVSVLLAEQASERNIPILFNYHTPTVSCLRGTLLRWGSEICDGHLENRPCGSCALHGHGLNRTLATLISSLPPIASRLIGTTGLSGGVWTALRMPELVELRIQAFHRLIKLVDKVIALCEWARKLLIRNGVPQSKIALCRQGIAWEAGDYSNNHPPPRPELPIRAAFLGRLDPTKGVHIVVEALKHNAALAVQLDLFGVRQGQVGDQYASRVGELIAGDTRIQIMPPVSPDKVVHQLREYDVLVVPSQWMETGPLVVLEAFAAGIPVMGSNLGGIAELVRDGVDGLLIEPASSPLAWAASFRRLCSNPAELSSLRKGIRRSRHTREVALELMPLYGRSVKITPKVSKYKRPQTNKIR